MHTTKTINYFLVKILALQNIPFEHQIYQSTKVRTAAIVKHRSRVTCFDEGRLLAALPRLVPVYKFWRES